MREKEMTDKFSFHSRPHGLKSWILIESVLLMDNNDAREALYFVLPPSFHAYFRRPARNFVI
jgi:hypothetical protein